MVVCRQNLPRNDTKTTRETTNLIGWWQIAVDDVTNTTLKSAPPGLVEHAYRGANAMRMTLKVPIRMVLGVVEHVCAIKPVGMCQRHPERDLTYDSGGHAFQGRRAVDRRRRRAGRASFAKKKPDVACQGPDLSPGGRRCAWCESLQKSIFPCRRCPRSVACQPPVQDYTVN